MTHSGSDFLIIALGTLVVLIPLLLDDPLWVMRNGIWVTKYVVLIPLLLDDPLWEVK